MISSIDIVERKGGRPLYYYCQLHYIVESDFFSFHAIQMPEMFNFEIEPDITSQCISNHTSGIIVVYCGCGLLRVIFESLVVCFYIIKFGQIYSFRMK